MDINSVSTELLKSLPGIAVPLAYSVTSHRFTILLSTPLVT
jgi:hypothetical protein